MPHKQKEGHDHSTFSKKQALEKKRAKDVAKKAKEEAKLVEEEAKKLLLGNNVPLVDGHGEYELGYEPDEKEQRYNKLKRCRKHLRGDLRIKQLKEEEEQRVAKEERQRTERLAVEAETAHKRREERRVAGEEVTDSEDDESEDEEELQELVVYFCECCNRKYATRNSFINHMNSKRHRMSAAPYEEAGLLVYSLEVKTTDNEGDCSDSEESDVDIDIDAEEEDDMNDVAKPTAIGFSALDLGSSSDDDDDNDDEGSKNTNESVSEGSDEGDDKKPSIFAALGDSEKSGSDSSDDEHQKDNEEFIAYHALPPMHVMTEEELAAQIAAENEAEDMYLEELILQNKLRQAEIGLLADQDLSLSASSPFPFTNEFDAELYPGINEARFARIRHKLQSKLAEKGIEPKVSELTEICNGLDPVALGRSLLQQVMAARMDNLQARLNAYNTYKKEQQLMVKEFTFANGNSKALASQYTYRLDPADNLRRRANVHHAGSHYHMASASGRTKGTVTGMSSRHSSQGARLQASRVQAKETARIQSGGMMMKNKSGKVTSKKMSGKSNKGSRGKGDVGDP